MEKPNFWTSVDGYFFAIQWSKSLPTVDMTKGAFDRFLNELDGLMSKKPIDDTKEIRIKVFEKLRILMETAVEMKKKELLRSSQETPSEPSLEDD